MDNITKILSVFLVISFIVFYRMLFCKEHIEQTCHFKDEGIYMTIWQKDENLYYITFYKNPDKLEKDRVIIYHEPNDKPGLHAIFNTLKNDTIYINSGGSDIIWVKQVEFKLKISDYSENNLNKWIDSIRSSGKRDYTRIRIYPMDEVDVWNDSVYLGEASYVKSE